MDFLCCNIDTIANVTVALFALVAIFQTTRATRQTKRDSFINLVLTMYTECRKVIDSTRIEGWERNTAPIGLECFKSAYDTLFHAKLTKHIDKSKSLTEQVEENVVPTISDVEQQFNEIVNITSPNIGTYLSSFVSILVLIDWKKSLGKENKKHCISYIKAQTTKYEKVWLHHYCILKKKMQIFFINTT